MGLFLPLFCSCLFPMIYLKLTGELICWEFVPFLYEAVSHTLEWADNIPAPLWAHRAVHRKTRAAALSTVSGWNQLNVLLNRCPLWSSRPNTPNEFGLGGGLGTFIGWQSSQRHCFWNPTKAICLLLAFPPQSLHQHCRALVLLCLSWTWPRSPQGWVPPLHMQVSISRRHLPGPRPLTSEMLHRFLTLFKVSSHSFTHPNLRQDPLICFLNEIPKSTPSVGYVTFNDSEMYSLGFHNSKVFCPLSFSVYCLFHWVNERDRDSAALWRTGPVTPSQKHIIIIISDTDPQIG